MLDNSQNIPTQRSTTTRARPLWLTTIYCAALCTFIFLLVIALHDVDIENLVQTAPRPLSTSKTTKLDVYGSPDSTSRSSRKLLVSRDSGSIGDIVGLGSGLSNSLLVAIIVLLAVVILLVWTIFILVCCRTASICENPLGCPWYCLLSNTSGRSRRRVPRKLLDVEHEGQKALSSLADANDSDGDE
ncbi:hypothetical protein SCHPADRAFT_889091 [Schizopora paradoxa]|uniref:Uncharacterized protein n=1 Tax=Schizopora paradoxa TaxID=27342 RepID=A0A0H2RRP3_9AGAM|nr:hypothetical protein SCHPADRAFT_889091 [Schizopora paradoxa]